MTLGPPAAPHLATGVAWICCPFLLGDDPEMVELEIADCLAEAWSKKSTHQSIGVALDTHRYSLYCI